MGVVENALMKGDFVLIETEKVANAVSQVLVILGCPFLDTVNILINCWNDMIRMSFRNIALELNMFSLQTQPFGFDNVEFSTLNWVEDSMFDDEFDGIFTTEYESFLIYDESEYDVF